MSPYISGFLIFLIISLFLGAFFILLYTNKLKLNDESLDKQPLFWFAVLSPIVLFLIFGVITWKDYMPDLSKAGLDKFAEISKFPLAILALSPIFGVIVSNVHRTIQTEKQIEKTEEQISITKSKNNFDSFNSHMKIICDELKEFKVTLLSCEYVIKNKMKLYRDIFDKSSDLHGVNNTISDGFISELDNLHGNLYQQAGEYLSELYFNTDNGVLIYEENKEIIDHHVYGIHDNIVCLFEHFRLFQENYTFLDLTYDKSEDYNQLNIMNNIWKVLNEINIFIERFLYSIGYDFSLENEFTKNFYSSYMVRKALGQNAIEYKKANINENIEE
ncbi:TPA: hypothetical protein ACS7ZY_001263 [Providencia alcalifaciens]